MMIILHFQVYFVFIIIDQERKHEDETSRVKAKIVDENEHVSSDDTDDTNAGSDII